MHLEDMKQGMNGSEADRNNCANLLCICNNPKTDLGNS